VRHNGAALLAGAIFLALSAGMAPFRIALVDPPAAEAQNIGQRVVEGKVIDADSAPVSGATIFLKNLKTKSIRSYTSESDGAFRFTQVNMADDHELWAEKGSKRSATKDISPWDSRTDFQCELRLK
jgi:hypothetical protein